VSAVTPVSISYNVWAHDAPTLAVQQSVRKAGAALGLLPALHDASASKSARAAVLEAAAVRLVRVVRDDAATDDDARAWLHERMTTRWQVRLRARSHTRRRGGRVACVRVARAFARERAAVKSCVRVRVRVRVACGAYARGAWRVCDAAAVPRR
jgi:hypothetical protein